MNVVWAYGRRERARFNGDIVAGKSHRQPYPRPEAGTSDYFGRFARKLVQQFLAWTRVALGTDVNETIAAITRAVTANSAFELGLDVRKRARLLTNHSSGEYAEPFMRLNLAGNAE